jgi:3-deoxy-7-phosphoheptulonate synthase
MKSFKIDNNVIGGKELCLIAGPCSVESEEQMLAIAKEVSSLGIRFVRGGAFKSRTSPNTFQGLHERGLKILKKSADLYNLMVVSEVNSETQLDIAKNYCDVLQVGARSMQNTSLLKALGKYNKPVILKRAMSSTIEEWIEASNYIRYAGNDNIILCERGIRTFETATRNTLDILAIPVIKEKCGLPIIVDPSHASGNSNYVLSASLAAIAAGADGLMIEVHNKPKHALSDPNQQITPEQLKSYMSSFKKVAQAVSRQIF